MEPEGGVPCTWAEITSWALGPWISGRRSTRNKCLDVLLGISLIPTDSVVLQPSVNHKAVNSHPKASASYYVIKTLVIDLSLGSV